MTLPVLAGGIYLPPGHPREEEIRWQLRLPNPERERVAKLRRQGRRIRQPEPWVEACVVLPEGHAWYGGLAVPRHGIELDVDDRRTAPAATPLPFSPILRPYQSDALQAWQAAGEEGLVEAPCGSGKTVIGLAAVACTPTPALVLVHTHDLLNQWAERAQSEWWDVEVIADGSGPKDGRLVVATIQTLYQWDFWERHRWARQFGLVVQDEAHHVPAMMFSEVMLTLPARRRLALSATPERSDGLTQILHWHCGPTVYQVEQEVLVDAAVVLAPDVEPVRTGWEPDERIEWTKMINRATLDEPRNDLLLRRLRRETDKGARILVLTERREHAELIAGQLQDAWIGAVAVHSRLKDRDRKARLEAVASDDAQVLVATQLADEGLDLPALDTLVLTCPQKGGGRLRQRVGRVSRTAVGKGGAKVLDLVDSGWLAKLWYSRERTYRELGCRVGRAA